MFGTGVLPSSTRVPDVLAERIAVSPNTRTFTSLMLSDMYRRVPVRYDAMISGLVDSWPVTVYAT